MSRGLRSDRRALGAMGMKGYLWDRMCRDMKRNSGRAKARAKLLRPTMVTRGILKAAGGAAKIVRGVLNPLKRLFGVRKQTAGK